MLLSTILTLIVAAAATPVKLPVSETESAVVVTRQLLSDRTGITENQFSRRIGGGCKDIIFVWARGSTEVGNMVSSHSPNMRLVLTVCTRELSSDSPLAMNSVVNTATSLQSRALITQLFCPPTSCLAVLTLSPNARCATSWRTSIALAPRLSLYAVATRMSSSNSHLSLC
jgi:hypothetical protein